MTRNVRALGAVVLVALAGGTADVLSAQSPTDPTFEAASIRPNNSGAKGTAIGMQPGRYTATNISLRTLIMDAYGLESAQLLGGAGWGTADRFDIIATLPAGEPSPSFAPPGADPTPLQVMLQTLLADRFQLVVHHESRQLPIYALVTARSDRKLGPHIHPTTVDCAAALAGPATLKEKEGKEKSKTAGGGTRTTPRTPGQREPCTMAVDPGRISASAMTMAALASSLSGAVPRTVLDRTGLAGAFDVQLTWTPEQLPQKSTAVDSSRNKGAKPDPLAKIDPNGPGIFTALQEQLGLKLQSAKGPVDVLVIDHAERPTN